MARTPKLKVYRTPIGFHDAYVAAPSQKAALRAWGSDADLFARGIAETVHDPELAREPLAKPGTVVKRARGSAAEQLAALPPDRPKRRTAAPEREESVARPASRPVAKRRPRPSRARLEAVEAAIAAADQAHREERAGIAQEEERLARRHRELEEAHAAAAVRLEKRRDAAQRAYDKALRAWRG